MFFDRVTEEIAHFIGLFLATEGAGRPAPMYDPFEAPWTDPDLGPLLFPGTIYRFLYGPQGYTPDGGGIPASDSGGVPLLPRTLPLPPPGDVALFGPGLSLPPAPEPALLPFLPPPGQFFLLAPPPGSVATLTWQINELSDRDVLDVSPEVVAAWRLWQAPRLEALTTKAEALQPLDLAAWALPSGTSEIGAEGLALAVARFAEQAEAAAEHGETFTVIGPAAYGTFVDGEAAARMPKLSDAAPRLPEVEQTWLPGMPAPVFTIGDGSVGAITGGNVAMNVAVGSHVRVDAPLILVGGDAISLDLVSQVAVLADDRFGAAAAGAEGGNLVQNAARLTPGAQIVETPELGETDRLPETVILSRITGDLVNYSWTSQVNAGDDGDAVTLSGGSSWVLTGGNQLFNLEQLATSGMAFDLILVGGDMLTVFATAQIAALFDVDKVPAMATAPGAQTPSPYPGGEGDPGDGLRVAPAASAFPKSPYAEAASVSDGPGGAGAAGSASPAALPAGAAIDAATMPGTSDTGAGVNTQPGGEGAAPDPTPAKAGAAPQTPAETVLGPGSHGNVVSNTADIVHSSLDSLSALTGELKEMLANFDPDAPWLDPILSVPALADLDIVRVLHVSGDLVNVHAVKQTTVLSDADLVAGPGAASAITGANMVANTAATVDIGMDSVVMAGGDLYTDAFLHQAEFVDFHDPGGVGGAGPPSTSALASEAVAFLADGMLDAQFGALGGIDTEAHLAMANLGDAGPPADIMQVMLS
jgi:hypothetical protein